MRSGIPAAPSPPPANRPEPPAPARPRPSDAPCATPLTNPRCDSRSRFPLPETLQSINQHDAKPGELDSQRRNGRVGKSKTPKQRVRGSNPTRATDRPHRPKPKTRTPQHPTPPRRHAATPTRRHADTPSRLTACRTFFAAPQMSASANARAAIEIGDEDMESVNLRHLDGRTGDYAGRQRWLQHEA